MNNQKDIKNKETNSYGHTESTSSNIILHKPLYETVNKKTEKLVTALYMVTDCMDTDDALKAKLRFLSVELLSDIFKLSTLPQSEKSAVSTAAIVRINELLSCVTISTAIGYISEMNSSILHREFKKLVSDLESYKSKDSHFAFTLSDTLFEETEPSYPHHNTVKDPIKDTLGYKGHEYKKTFTTPSFTSKMLPVLQSKRLSIQSIDREVKEDRAEKILLLIKDKKNTPGFADGVSIKDISGAFSDRSEKTIQRELNSLVAKGKIKKIGAKRWSRYQAL